MKLWLALVGVGGWIVGLIGLGVSTLLWPMVGFSLTTSLPALGQPILTIFPLATTFPLLVIILAQISLIGFAVLSRLDSTSAAPTPSSAPE